uniref:SPARC (osteonectin), cwcv and kazal like domains proteoglycan 3 n=1 Tax=Sinocyclocheilus grahami TaxID=75366 RepID=A0A672L3D3_SINGR
MQMLVLVGVCALLIAGASARNDNGNFLDDKWLTGRWDKFRDEPGTWSPGKPFDQALDPAKDPCLKIKCGRHKVCVAEDYQTPTCVSQRRMSFKDMNMNSPLLKCKRCPVVHPSPVCGTDGHCYSTKCKLEYQACISGKQISVKCPGQCPCPSGNPAEKRGTHTLLMQLTHKDLHTITAFVLKGICALHIVPYRYLATKGPCQSEITIIHKQQAGKKLLGPYIPSCDEDGFYRPQQCHRSRGQCWCVDRNGNEIEGSHTHGPADCGKRGASYITSDLLIHYLVKEKSKIINR